MLPQMSFYTDNARLGRSKVLRVLEIEQHALDERLIEAPHTGVEVLERSSYGSSEPQKD